MQSNTNLAAGTTSGILNGTCSPPSAAGGRMISMPSNGEMIQIQPNGGGTVLVVNLPPATSAMDLNSALSASQARINTTNTANATCSSSGASSSSNVNALVGNANAHFVEVSN